MYYNRRGKTPLKRVLYLRLRHCISRDSCTGIYLEKLLLLLFFFFFFFFLLLLFFGGTPDVCTHPQTHLPSIVLCVLMYKFIFWEETYPGFPPPDKTLSCSRQAFRLFHVSNRNTMNIIYTYNVQAMHSFLSD